MSLTSYAGCNIGNANMYSMSQAGIVTFLGQLWSQKIFGKTFAEITDRADLIYSVIRYPFQIAPLGAGDAATKALSMIGPALNGVRVGNVFLEPKYPGGGDAIGDPLLVQCVNSEVCSFRFERISLDTILNNNFSDYGTMSEYLLYLPYIGFITIDSEIIIHALRITISYFIDASTARICAITEYTLPDDGGVIRFNESYGYCGYQLPFSGRDSGALRDALTNAIGKGIGAAGILMGKPYLTTISNSVKDTNVSQSSRTTTRNPETNRQITAGTSERSVNVSGGETTTHNRYLSKNSAYAEIFSGLANFYNCRTPTSMHSNYTSADCWVTLGTPYIIAKKPKVIYSAGFDSLFGRPLYVYKQLKTLRGFTKLSSIHLNVSCTNNELTEIEQLLYEGVILNTNVEIPDTPEPVAPTPPPDIPVETDPIITPQPTLPEGETATMLCCFNGKFRVTGMRGTPAQTGRENNHYGLDMVGEDSTNVYAISSGWVKLTDEGSYGLGKCVRVQMDNQNYYGEWILYGHLSKFEVKNGQYVEKGQLLGVMGNTGASRGAHTHLEWRNKYDKYDPDFSKYNICDFTGIPNTSVTGQNTHIGSPIYKTANGASVQSKLGLENQTIEYLENYKYADDLMKKIDEHTK